VKADYPWQELYEAAVVETNREQMHPLIQAAKAAIDARLHDLQMDHGGTPEERHASAMHMLALIGCAER
jgi:hypothetical protein